MSNYNQLVLWIGTIVGEENIEEFEKYFEEQFGFRVKYFKEFKLLNEYENNCVLFYIHSEDIPKFSLFRIQTNDMKWFEDYVENNISEIPSEILEWYPKYIKNYL